MVILSVASMCLLVRALKGKRLELSAPLSVKIRSTADPGHTLTPGSESQRMGDMCGSAVHIETAVYMFLSFFAVTGKRPDPHIHRVPKTSTFYFFNNSVTN